MAVRGAKSQAMFGFCAMLTATTLALASWPARAQSPLHRAEPTTSAASLPPAPASPVAEPCGAQQVVGARVALLIGNSRYTGEGWPRLPNADNDIGAVCAALMRTGFSVQVVRDADFLTLQQRLADFADAAAEASSVIIYYAGHGFEYSGQNFIVPVGAPIRTSRNDIDLQYVSLDSLVQQVVPDTAFGLLFIDACRTPDPIVTLLDPDPRAADGVVSTVGLLTIKQGAVLYSTARGRPAFDDAPVGSPTSPFAAALTRSIATPGIELAELFRLVSRDVYRATLGIANGPQQPFHYGSWFEDFYLIPRSEERFVPPPVAIQSAPVLSSVMAVRASPWARADAPVPQTVAPTMLDASGSVVELPPAIVFVAPPPREPEPLDPLGLTLDRLAVEDEPELVADLLSRRPISHIAAQAEADSAVDPEDRRIAQYLLGYMYEYGVGVRQDLDLARGWLANAAQDGFAPGQLEYGYFLAEHSRGPADIVEAERFYRAAAATGYAKAQTHLAYRLSTDLFGPPDYDEARRLYMAAAEQGHPAAMFALTADPLLRPQMLARLRTLAAVPNLAASAWVCEAEYNIGAAASAMSDCLVAARAGFASPRAILAHCAATGACGSPAAPADARFWATLARSQSELRADLRASIADIPAD